mgnify:CR=1 FL=1
MKFEQRPKEVKEQGSFLKESFLGEGIASVKTLRQGLGYGDPGKGKVVK